jgi:peroxiredoxin
MAFRRPPVRWSPRAFLAAALLTAAAGPAEAKHLAALGAVELREPLAAPDFSLPTLSGEPAGVRDHRGKVVLLTFWATWCIPCIEEMPALERLHRELSGEGFTVLAVSIDAQGAAVVGPFWEKAGHSFPTLLDARQQVATRYAAWALPTAFVIDRAGQVVARIQGPRTWDSEAVRAAVRALLR